MLFRSSQYSAFPGEPSERTNRRKRAVRCMGSWKELSQSLTRRFVECSISTPSNPDPWPPPSPAVAGTSTVSATIATSISMVTMGDITSVTVEEETSARHKRVAAGTSRVRSTIRLLILRHPHPSSNYPRILRGARSSHPQPLPLAGPSLVEPLTSASVVADDTQPWSS